MKKLFLVFLSAVFFSACDYDDTYPDIPALEFKSLTFSDDFVAKTVTLTATFTDGDGDIGYYQDRPNDSIFDNPNSPYYYNFVISLQVFSNGVWIDTAIVNDIDFNEDSIDSDNDTTWFNEVASSRLPYLTQTGQNKGLKGDIEKTNFLPYLSGDTIRFSAFIYDRSRNKSNLIYTPGYFVKNP